MRLKSLLTVLILILSLSACSSFKFKADPSVCQPMVTYKKAIVDGAETLIIDLEKSYWFCVKRSDPNNEKLHTRPLLMEFINNSHPVAVSAKDYADLVKAEKEALDYIKYLEDKVNNCGVSGSSTKESK